MKRLTVAMYERCIFDRGMNLRRKKQWRELAHESKGRLTPASVHASITTAALLCTAVKLETRTCSVEE